MTDTETHTDLARRIHAASHLTGEFTLRSGRTATEYFDKYRFEGDPVLLDEIARRMAPLVPPGTEVLCVIDRGQGGAGALAAEGIRLRSLLTADDLRAAAA
ncbi:hypothetical protein GCM10009759_12120 [Kitasatospora saccharophila]|uniref:Orotate phosphoribosyltransferase n=1 Tax=Kitasatospora saccharophila TaxID=407973 RepID=A0ABN2WD25_9ACTN